MHMKKVTYRPYGFAEGKNYLRTFITFSFHPFFFSVLGPLSLFDLFVLEQSLKCDYCSNRDDCWDTSKEV